MNSKAKGSGFERTICKVLSKWIQGTEKPYLFWRSSNSGGTATINQMFGEMSGDIIAVHENGKVLTNLFSIEIKNGYPQAQVEKSLKDNKNDDIRDFWIQCCGDAHNAKKLPLLIYSKKGNVPKNMMIGFDTKGINSFTKLNKLPSVRISFGEKFELDDLYLFNFQDFLDVVSKGDLEELCKCRL